ncbi:hypothetical protein C3L33_01186, partial [Rhododendron williamsianum]
MVSKSRRRQSGDDGSNRSSSHEMKVKAAPHFFKIIHSSVVPHQKLNVPLKFVKKYLRDNQKSISLRISDGTTWLVRFYAGAMNGKRNLGWGPFVRDNNLKVGDICVFELISTGIEPQLDVTIFRK